MTEVAKNVTEVAKNVCGTGNNISKNQQNHFIKKITLFSKYTVQEKVLFMTLAQLP